MSRLQIYHLKKELANLVLFMRHKAQNFEVVYTFT